MLAPHDIIITDKKGDKKMTQELIDAFLEAWDNLEEYGISICIDDRIIYIDEVSFDTDMVEEN